MSIRIIGKGGSGASVAYSNTEPDCHDIIWADTSLVETGGSVIFKMFDNSPSINDWVVISYSGGDATFASSVVTTPYGDLIGTDVQAQIRELEDNKAKLIDGEVPLSQLPNSLKESFVVENISERNSVPNPYKGMRVFVIDATNDETVEQGGAEYIYFNDEWRKISEVESMDVILSWDNVLNKPDVFIKDVHTTDEITEGSINLFYTDDRVASYLEFVLKDTNSTQILIDEITNEIGLNVKVDNETIETDPTSGIKIKFNDTVTTNSNVWSAEKIKQEIDNIDHNSLKNLQGGNSQQNEFLHLTQEEKDKYDEYEETLIDYGREINEINEDVNEINLRLDDVNDELLNLENLIENKKGAEFYDNETLFPIFGEVDTLYVAKSDTLLNSPAIYIWDEMNNEYSLMSGEGSAVEGSDYKDVVFVLGDNLEEGGQPHSEIIFPYNGVLEQVHVTLGLDSNNSSNLIFSLQKRVGTSWSNITTMEMQTGGYSKTFNLNSLINKNDRLRVNLISGDYSRVSSMSLIAHIKLN